MKYQSKIQKRRRKKHALHRPHLSPKERLKIREMRYKEYKTLWEIAEHFGRSIECIRRIVWPCPRGAGARGKKIRKKLESRRNLT